MESLSLCFCAPSANEALMLQLLLASTQSDMKRYDVSGASECELYVEIPKQKVGTCHSHSSRVRIQRNGAASGFALLEMIKFPSIPAPCMCDSQFIMPIFKETLTGTPNER